jgi:hypothetical protein
MCGIAAIDLLPTFAREMLALSPAPLARPPALFATRALGRTLRWAFRQ